MSLWPASMVCSKTRFLIAGRKGALRRACTTASCFATIKAVGVSEPRTNSIVGMRWRRSGPTGAHQYRSRAKASSESKGVTRINPATGRCRARYAAAADPMLNPTAMMG